MSETILVYAFNEGQKSIKKINKRCAVLMAATAYLAYAVSRRFNKQDEKIEKLTKEIEELKSQKGE